MGHQDPVPSSLAAGTSGRFRRPLCLGSGPLLALGDVQRANPMITQDGWFAQGDEKGQTGPSRDGRTHSWRRGVGDEPMGVGTSLPALTLLLTAGCSSPVLGSAYISPSTGRNQLRGVLAITDGEHVRTLLFRWGLGARAID